MKNFFCWLLSLALSVMIISNARSSVTIIPPSPNDKQVADFPFVGSVWNTENNSAGSGTVIGDGSFVLTARHVITHNGQARGMILDACNFKFEIGGKVFLVEKVYGHPISDIAIIKLKGTFDKTAKLSFSSDFMGCDFYGVGFGKSSTHSTFDCIKWDIDYGTKRIYKNTFSGDAFEVVISDTKVAADKILSFYLRDPTTFGDEGGAILGEGMHGPGDSGGGAFIVEEDELHLVGVITAMTMKAPYIGYIVDVSMSRDWITALVPNCIALPCNQEPKVQERRFRIYGAFMFSLTTSFDNYPECFVEERKRRFK